ncbi:MAG: glycosyltransferase, partial [Polyangiales bacterium]
MILHVACLPFPTHQGTQAAVAAMLDASAASGRHVELLTYAQSGYALDTRYEVHRIPDFPKVRSLRSGPSWGKLALDARCILEIRRLAKLRQPHAIIAHHIEAGAAALAARVAPVYYVAHTSLQHELPVYLPLLPSGIVSEVSRRVERTLCQGAAGVAAVAPSLAALLGRGTKYLPVPWPIPLGAPAEPAEARRSLGIASEARVCLYAGNLDPYQGWEHLIEALAVLRRSLPGARLLIATESDPRPVYAEAAL